jgi:hypothetical protein
MINDYKALLQDLIANGEDMLDLDNLEQAKGLSLATTMIANLIAIHEEQVNTRE